MTEEIGEKQVFVLLPVHNRKAITLEFVRTLARQTYQNIQLILIDDGSTDGTAGEVCDVLLSTKVIRGDGNLWWAGALQKGIDYLKSLPADPDSVVLMINDDTLIPGDFVAVGAKVVSASEKKIYCARSYSQQTGELSDMGVRVNWWKYQFIPAKREEEINCLSTRGLFMKFSDVLAIGEFMPDYLPHYYSDYEFTIRARARGYQLCCPEQLKLKMNEATTGMHVADGLGLRAYIKKAFQIRSAINPWSAAKFITVAAPWWLRPICYFRLTVYFAKCLVKAARNGI